MSKFVKKNQKKTVLGHFVYFFPIIGKNEFFWKKKPLSVFKYSNYLPKHKKMRKLRSNS